MRFLFFFLFVSFLIPSGTAQKFLQIEKVNSLKVRKFYIGDEITFQVEDFPDYWRTEIIDNILVEEEVLLFSQGMVNVGDIKAIRTYDTRPLANRASIGLYSFGAGWVFFSLADALLGGALTWSVAIVSGTAFATGFIFKQIFKHRTHKIGKRKRLRLLDLTFKKPLGP